MVQKSFKIAASILAADMAQLGIEAKHALDAGADIIHIDVMDNHYVPNLTFGPAIVSALRDYGISAPLDVHLMTEPVDSLIVAFAKAGANSISFHPDASTHTDRSLQLIRDQGCEAGLALNPATTLDCLQYVMDKLHFILLMSVNPGFGGQAFIESALHKLQNTKALIDKTKYPIRLHIDGGVGIDNISRTAAAGADTFVVGTAIFGSHDYCTTLAAMRMALSKNQQQCDGTRADTLTLRS